MWNSSPNNVKWFEKSANFPKISSDTQNKKSSVRYNWHLLDFIEHRISLDLWPSNLAKSLKPLYQEIYLIRLIIYTENTVVEVIMFIIMTFVLVSTLKNLKIGQLNRKGIITFCLKLPSSLTRRCLLRHKKLRKDKITNKFGFKAAEMKGG